MPFEIDASKQRRVMAIIGVFVIIIVAVVVVVVVVNVGMMVVLLCLIDPSSFARVRVDDFEYP